MPEGKSEEPALHPSETFSWLQREEYFKKRDSYVEQTAHLIDNALAQTPEFAYHDDAEVRQIAARLYSRGLFVTDYLKANVPHDTSIPIKTMFDVYMPVNVIRAGSMPVFYRGDQWVPDYTKLTPADAEQIKLSEVNVIYNMNRLGWDVMDSRSLANELRHQHGDEHVEKFMLEWLGRKVEQAMVEEMAHAFYDIDHAHTLEGRRKLFEGYKSYPWRNEMDDTHPTQEPDPKRRRAYLNHPKEKDAAKWVAPFTDHYYPDMPKEPEG